MLSGTTPGDDDTTAPPARDRSPANRVVLRAGLRAPLPDATSAVAVMPFMDGPGMYWMYLLS